MKKSPDKNSWVSDRQFTKEELERLREILKKFPKESVETFINELEVFCVLEKIYRKRRGAVTENRADRRRILRHIEKARADLLLLVDQKLQAQEDKSLLDVGIMSGLISTTSSEMARAAAALIEEEQRRYYVMLNTATALKEIAFFIESDRNQAGRPKAEDADGDLVTLIARSFQYHLKRPTVYSGSGKRGGGTFLAVVELTLKKCGIASKDNSWHIRQALKNL